MQDFSTRRFAWWVVGGLVTASAIITVAALLSIAPFGYADEELRDALPEPQGQTGSNASDGM